MGGLGAPILSVHLISRHANIFLSLAVKGFTVVRRERVPLVRASGVLATRGMPVFLLKIDIEGFEGVVLQVRNRAKEDGESLSSHQRRGSFFLSPCYTGSP